MTSLKEMEQESRIYRKFGEMSLVSSAGGTNKTAVWLGEERRAKADSCLATYTDFLEVDGGTKHEVNNGTWLNEWNNRIAGLKEILTIADGVGHLQEEDQASVEEA